LQRSEFELSCTMEGKNIAVKLGNTRKETLDGALKQLKKAQSEFNSNVRDARHDAMNTLKKLEKIVAKDEVKVIEKELQKVQGEFEAKGLKMIGEKEKELKRA